MEKNKKNNNAVEVKATEVVAETAEPTEPTAEATEVAAETAEPTEPTAEATEVAAETAEPTAEATEVVAEPTEPTEPTAEATEKETKPKISNEDEIIAGSVADAINECIEDGSWKFKGNDKRTFAFAWHKCFDIQTPFTEWWKIIESQLN